MEWARYKWLCDQPNFMSRNLIERTSEFAQQSGEQALSLILLESLQDTHELQRPADHRGDQRSHMFEVFFSSSQVDQVLQMLTALDRGEAKHERGRKLTGIRAAWVEYQQWMATHR